MTIGKSVANQLHKLIHSTYLERQGKCSVFSEDGVIQYYPPQRARKADASSSFKPFVRAIKGIVGCVWFYLQKMELRYWQEYDEEKTIINLLNEKRSQTRWCCGKYSCQSFPVKFRHGNKNSIILFFWVVFLITQIKEKSQKTFFKV